MSSKLILGGTEEQLPWGGTLTVVGVPADDLLAYLSVQEREGAIIIRQSGDEAVVNRYWESVARAWRWGYQANYSGGVQSAGPFLTRWGAHRAALKLLREKT